MSISSVGPASFTTPVLPKTAPDGDSPAVEAAETAATERAEKANGGIAPATNTSTSTGGVNKLV